MTKLLYGVSPIGLGHSSRAVAIGTELLERGAEVTFATGGPAVAFLRSYGFEVFDVVTEPNPIIWNGRNVLPSLWYYRYWRGYKASKTRARRVAEELKPDCVVGDEEFSVLSVALEKGLRAIMISDELELGFARTFLSRSIESRVARWYKELQTSVDLLVVPEEGSDEGKLWHSGPVVRKVTAGRDETRKSLGLPLEGALILLTLSGSGSGSHLIPAVESAVESAGLSATVAVAGGRGGPAQGRTRHLGFVRDLQNLVAGADLCVSLAGKSTIDEALSAGTPMIALPLKDHFEQEANAKALGFTHGDIARLGPLMVDRLGRRQPPRKYDGAVKAAVRILEMC
ncbi:MAG TPA: glycosyltransferase [Conexivisphaerales archaeon]|nr:glycosyltransferase [Conexivisphaerales archaeon]